MADDKSIPDKVQQDVSKEAKEIVEKLNGGKPADDDGSQPPADANAPSGAEQKPNLRKKRIIIVAIIVLLLVGIGVGGFLFFKKKNHKKEENKEEKPVVIEEKSVYLDLEDFIVNLSTGDGKPRFLKMVVSLEISTDEDKLKIIGSMPKIRDSFQIYLRELRAEDLRGSESLFRLREELLFRINKVMYPVAIKDILFNEVLVQ